MATLGNRLVEYSVGDNSFTLRVHIFRMSDLRCHFNTAKGYVMTYTPIHVDFDN